MTTLQEQARAEAYASAPIDQIIHPVVELDTPAFPQPLYFIAGLEADTAIVLETGQTVTATALAFEMTPPGFESSGPTPARLRIDGVASQLYGPLKSVTSAIKVTYRAYLAGDFANVVDLIEGLQFTNVSLTASAAEGELSFAEIASQAFPRRTYSLDDYPGLWNS